MSSFQNFLLSPAALLPDCNNCIKFKLLVMMNGIFWDVTPCDPCKNRLILSTMMMEAVCSSKTSVLTRGTWHHIPEDSILFVKYLFLEGNIVSFSRSIYITNQQ
jgi:hypothetical protein